MASLPPGAVLTSINGRLCTAVPRNSTTSSGGLAPTVQSTPIPTPSDNRPGRLPPSVTSIGGILLEQPEGASSLSSSSSSTTTPPTPGVLPPSSSNDDSEPITPGPIGVGLGSSQVTDVPAGEVPASEGAAGETAGGVAGGVAGETAGGTSVAEAPEQSTVAGDGAGNPTNSIPGVGPSSEPGDEDDTPTPSSTSPTTGADSGDGEGTNEAEPTESLGEGANQDDSQDGDDQSQGGNTDPSNTDGSPEAMTTTLADGVVTTIPGGGVMRSGNPEPSASDMPETGAVGSSSESSGQITPQKAGVIAGSVIGAVAALALIAALIWFFRRRSQKHRYVIQTPVMDPPTTGRSAKTWEFDTGSIGPTHRTARIAEAVGYKFNSLSRRLKSASPRGSPGVNLNRGNSQYTEAAAMRARSNSNLGSNGTGLSTKDRVGDWWSRLREDAKFNWRLRNEEVAEISPFAGTRGMEQRGNVVPNQIDRRGSSGSAQEFSGALGLMLDDARARGNDPFSDDHVIPRPPAGSNPFDDSHAAPQPSNVPPTTYSQRNQRPRGSTTGSLRRQPSAAPSRHHVRSDQFDLEIDSQSVARPSTAHTRHESFTSQVSSISNWSGPGPDVGAAALTWAEQRPASRSPRGIGEAL